MLLQDAERRLVDFVRESLETRRSVPRGGVPSEVVAQVSPFWGIAICLYQPGHERLLVIRAVPDAPGESLRMVLNRVLAHPRFEQFALRNRRRCRIQIDVIPESPQDTRWADLCELGFSSNRFEFGVDGLRVAHQGKVRYLLPGDCFVFSILGVKQLERRVKALFPGAATGELEVQRLRTQSWVSYGDDWVPLYRGIPVLGPVTFGDVFGAIQAAVGNVLRSRKPDGRFEYYYDAATDSCRNHEHPDRDPEADAYHNLLRHCGGVLTLQWWTATLRHSGVLATFPQLLHSQATATPLKTETDQLWSFESVSHAVRDAIEYYLRQLVDYVTPSGNRGCYAVCNHKGKLGGSGLGLYMLCQYQRLSGDNRYEALAHRLANHLLSEIQESGEFIYYHTYLDRHVTPAENAAFFSFYYPGEALIGLAEYRRLGELISPARHCASEAKNGVGDDCLCGLPDRFELDAKIHRALDFLVLHRPSLYQQHFATLPSDAWLMMAINEFWDIAEFRRTPYRDFVFHDADQMVRQMYTEQNALYPDYTGSFYYNYGDHPYPDGARAEGLLAAYQLAVKCGDNERAARYRAALARVVWALLHLCNTEVSTYAAKNPQRAIGGIRFKLTRQWFRIDTIEHVAGFFMKYLHTFLAPQSGPVPQLEQMVGSR